MLAAAAGVHAASSENDILNQIIDDLHQVVVLTVNITDTIGKFDGSSLAAALPITTSTNNLIAYLANATMKVKQNPENLTANGAQVLGPYSQGLAYTVNASIATLIQKKPAFMKNNLDPLVVSSLNTQINSSKTFSAAILAKIPPLLEPVAAAINSQVTDSIQQGIDCFSKNESCNPNIVNSSRTLDAAEATGAIGAASRTLTIGGWTAVLGAAFVAFAVGV